MKGHLKFTLTVPLIKKHLRFVRLEVVTLLEPQHLKQNVLGPQHLHTTTTATTQHHPTTTKHQAVDPLLLNPKGRIIYLLSVKERYLMSIV